jgi:hypothetical protein
MTHGWKVLFLSALLSAVATLTACDRFFTVHGRVVACVAETPLASVAITAHLDKDDFASSQELPDSYTTDADGKYDIDTGNDTGAWVTLTFEKDGFARLDHQLKGAFDTTLDLCLTPATTP